MERRFYLVDAQVLPEVFLKVVRAKELLASGEARSISAATRAVELSRSAFYKYKDCIFDSENGREVITVMATLRDDKDVLKLINNLIRNTTPKGAQSSDPFWEKSETALLQALMLYLLHEAPPEEQNFSMIMEMLGSAQVKEDDEEYQSPLDILFERLEMRNPESIAVKQYAIYKQAAGVVSLKRLLNQSNLKSWSSKMIKKSLEAYFFTLKNKIVFCKKQFQNMSVFCFVSTEIV